MKTSDLQQMMQQYQLIAENNGEQQDGLNLEARYDEITERVNEAYGQLAAAIEQMRQFLAYAENFDFEIDFVAWAENMEDACRDLLR
jgi:hypothetical protein